MASVEVPVKGSFVYAPTLKSIDDFPPLLFDFTAMKSVGMALRASGLEILNECRQNLDEAKLAEFEAALKAIDDALFPLDMVTAGSKIARALQNASCWHHASRLWTHVLQAQVLFRLPRPNEKCNIIRPDQAFTLVVDRCYTFTDASYCHLKNGDSLRAVQLYDDALKAAAGYQDRDDADLFWACVPHLRSYRERKMAAATDAAAAAPEPADPNALLEGLYELSADALEAMHLPRLGPDAFFEQVAAMSNVEFKFVTAFAMGDYKEAADLALDAVNKAEEHEVEMGYVRDSTNKVNLLMAGGALAMLEKLDSALPLLQRASAVADAWRNAFVPGGAIVRLDVPKDWAKDPVHVDQCEEKMFQGLGHLIQWLREQNRYSESVLCARLALRLCRQLNTYYHVISALLTFGRSLMGLPAAEQRPTEALHALTDALWWADATQWSNQRDRELLFMAMGDVARMCMLLQLHDVAIDLMKRSIPIAQTLGQKGEESLWLLYRRIGECYVQQDRWEEATTAFRYAVNVHKEAFHAEPSAKAVKKVKEVVRLSVKRPDMNYWTMCRQTDDGRPVTKCLQLMSAVDHLKLRLDAKWSPVAIRNFFKIEAAKDVVTVQRELKARGDLKIQNCWFFECGAAQQGAKFKRCGKCMIALYCSSGCQQNHWRMHKLICPTLEKARLQSANEAQLDQ